METNNKYYTPDKSEYHIGFEYQSLTDPRQPENDIAWSDEELRTEVDMMNVFKYMIEDDFLEHRCKYLDKELIIELGWKLVWTENETLVFRFNDWILTFNDFNKQIIITFGNDSLSRRFNGKLKNKNQLKILMKWLEIL